MITKLLLLWQPKFKKKLMAQRQSKPLRQRKELKSFKNILRKFRLDSKRNHSTSMILGLREVLLVLLNSKKLSKSKEKNLRNMLIMKRCSNSQKVKQTAAPK